MGSTARGGLTYADLLTYPDDHVKRELFDGELVVSPSPSRPHQRVLGRLLAALMAWAGGSGAEVTTAWDLQIAEGRVVWPDAMVVLADRVDLFTDGLPSLIPPDMAVEISSPSTRRRDLLAKRAYYEQFGVGEYWLVDLDEERILVFVLQKGAYGEPSVFRRGDLLESNLLKGFSAPVDELLG